MTNRDVYSNNYVDVYPDSPTYISVYERDRSGQIVPSKMITSFPSLFVQTVSDMDQEVVHPLMSSDAPKLQTFGSMNRVVSITGYLVDPISDKSNASVKGVRSDQILAWETFIDTYTTATVCASNNWIVKIIYQGRVLYGAVLDKTISISSSTQYLGTTTLTFLLLEETEIVRYDSKVFLDGVEVPHQGYTLSHSVGQPAQGSISVEPDEILSNLPPETVVEIYVKSDYRTDTQSEYEDDFINNYKLYFEGRVTAVQTILSGQSAITMLLIRSTFSLMDKVSIFATQLGGGLNTSFITGGNTFAPGNISPDGDPRFYKSIVDGMGPDLTDYGGGIKELINYSSRFSAVARQFTTRHRLLDKITSVPNPALKNIIKIKGAKDFIDKTIASSINEGSSVMDLIRYSLSIGFHSFTDMPFPYRKDKNTPKYKIGEDTDIPEASTRGDTVLLSNNYYMLPPPCNIVFPSQIVTWLHDVENDTKITRYILQDPARSLGVKTSAQYAYAAPYDLFSKAGVSPDVNGNILFGGMIVPGKSQTKDIYPQVSSENNTSALDFLSDEELMKGIIARQDIPQLDALAAFLAPQQEDVDNANASIQWHLSQVANYRFYALGRTERLSVQTTDMMFVAPGFPITVFSRPSCHIGLLTAVTTSVSPMGEVSASLVIENARPISNIPSVEAFSELDAYSSKLSLRLSALQTVINLKKSQKGITDDSEITIPNEILSQLYELRSNLQAIFGKHSLPTPPPYINPHTSSLENLDSLYSDILGCPAFYTADGDTVADDLQDLKEFITHPSLSTIVDLTLSAKSYIAGLSKLNSLYSFASPSSDNYTSGTWEKKFKEKMPLESLRRYENDNYLSRKGTTANLVMMDSGTKLTTEQSSGPIPYKFLVMRPSTTYSVDGSRLVWDDSKYSKLVDERAIATGIPSIEAVRLARGRVKDPMVTTTARQNNLISYATKHFANYIFNIK